MVNYANTKIVSIGAINHTPTEQSIVLTTSKPTLFLGDLKRKYKSFQEGTGKSLPIYQIIDEVGLNNITVRVLVEKPVANKQELNALIAEVKARISKPVTEVINETKVRQEITNERHRANLNIVMKLVGIDNTTQLFYNPNNIIERIFALEKSNETKKNYIKSIISIIPRTEENLILIYGNALKKLQEQIDEVKNKQQRSDIVYKTPNELHQISLQLKATNQYENYLISLFYTGVYYPTWRLKELQTMKVKNANKNTENYINWNNDTIVLNDYKTDMDYGRITLPLHKEVRTAILSLLQHRDNDSDYLITKNNGEPYSQPQLSLKIKQIMGYCVDDLRGLYITYNEEQGNLRTEEDKINFCKGMRNSPSVLKYYIKFV
jgi:integrase